MRLPAAALLVDDGQREVLERVARSGVAAHREVARARALLLASEGMANTQIAAKVGVSPTTVKAWRERFGEEGLNAFGGVRPGRGRKPSISPQKVAEIVRATLEDKPEAETHWSCRTMAVAQGVSPATVQRIWAARGLEPHRVKTFKLSNDKRFEQKLVDVVGLYLNPPENAVVLCMDEKSQIQALDRTQASLPIKKGRAGTMTHDYKRKRHDDPVRGARRAQRGGDRPMPAAPPPRGVPEVPAHDRPRGSKGLKVHLILDNYSTHKHENVKKWLAKHPRFALHFTPTANSWLNLVERFFVKLTDKAIRRGVFHSVPDLITAIEAYLAATNTHPTPFVWTATADQILVKVRRGRITLHQTPPKTETVH